MKSFLLSLFIFLIYRLLYMSWRIQVYENEELKTDLENHTPLIFAIWHGNELGVIHLAKRYPLCMMVSHSKDGELMTRVLGMLGAHVVRGSSSKGAIAGFKALLRASKANPCISFAVDGPRGPYRSIKPGVFESSRLTKAKVYACGFACSSYWMSRKSWNRAILPKPFAKIEIVWSPAIGPISRDQDSRSTDLRTELEAKFLDAEQLALTNLAHN